MDFVWPAPIAATAMGSDDTSRIALLSLGPATGIGGNRRVVGGVSVLERQVDVALALGCGRIWLSTPEQDGLAIRAQRMAEAGGAQFRLIQRGRQLLGSLRQQDELLVLAEGLVAGESKALEPLSGGPVILTIPAATGMAGGFERLDRDHCWAGGMVLPGRVIERLDELGGDIEPVSALLRAGRAARVRERAIPEPWAATGQWSLSTDRVPVADSGVDAGGSSYLQRFVTEPIGAWLVGRPRLALATLGSGALAAIGALACLYLALPAFSLLLVALSCCLLQCGVLSKKQGDARVFSAPKPGRLDALLPMVAEPVGALALASGLHTQFGWSSTLYIALLTVATWLLAGLGKHRMAELFTDRVALWLGTGLGGLAGFWIAGPALASALSLAAILLNMRNQPAITQA
ncbi:hypothetical protein LY632_08230 [Erythrobacter sp. SDW2]|uniref:hypothetical protein n=1 Tax=Erythrobacter sp. SDW2 TaxID=2907154 RepID=UPI001F213529|nr:hypothetical protein [Erythrobacter sp. SDW2]UIP05700.1 hypothetical protein LY632_08230 [Erythrobacter sp. SDW2]